MKNVIIASMMFAGLYGCQSSEDSPISSGASHPVTISTGNYSVAKLQDFIIPSAHAAVSDLTVCFKRLRFKKDINDDTVAETSEDNIDLSLGLVSLSSSGSALGTVSVPEGTYTRIEFDLESDCNGKSVDLVNDFGSFSTAARITIKFEGAFVVNGNENLVLGVQDILNAVNAHNGSQSLKDSLEAASGSL